MAYPTNPIYKLIKNPEGVVDCVKKQIGNKVIVIPFAEENTGYQKYLEWLAEGNTAEAAD
tara:strand:- start:141 stop:320 length:180 start_codon:yes stop_codon:yes gene_type:complete